MSLGMIKTPWHFKSALPVSRVVYCVIAISLCCAMLCVSNAQPHQGVKRHVIIFVLDYVSFNDLLTVRPPVMMRLISSGGIAALCIRTDGAFNPTNACMTVACGERVAASADGEIALNIFEPLECSDALSAYRRYTGRDVKPNDASVVVPYVEGLKRSLAKRLRHATPFVLGDLIKASGMRTAVIGCDDTSLGYDCGGMFRHAALIASPSDGTIALGDVSKRMLMPDAKAPFGVSVNLKALGEELEECFSDAQLLVIDVGETYRAALHAARAGDEAAAGLRVAALLKCDEALRLILKRFDERRDLIIVFTTTSPGTLKNELGFIIAYGVGVMKNSLLTSKTTRRIGLVSLTDIAPTALHHLGIKTDAQMVGRRMTSIKADDCVERVRKLIELTSQSDSLLRPIALYFMGTLQSLHAVLVLIWAICLRYSHGGSAVTLGKVGSGIGAFIMALPVSYWCEIMLRERIAMPFVTLLLVWLIALMLSAAFWMTLRSEPNYITLVGAISFIVVLADTFTGARLQLASIMGYSPYYGGRFYGLGNVGMAAALGCSLLLSCALSSILTHGLLRALVWICIGSLTAIAIGHPNMGANFGGLLSALPSFAVGYIAMQRMKVNWRGVPFAVAALMCIFVAFIAIDLLRGIEGMSHLGRFVVLLHERGFGAFASMVATKVLVWWRAFKHVPFTVALISYILCAVVCALFLRREIGSAIITDEMLRALVASFACGALVSFLINDSGPLTPVVMLSHGWSAIWLIIVRAIENAHQQSMA